MMERPILPPDGLEKKAKKFRNRPQLNCNKLTEIAIPENIVSIEANAFGSCPNLVDVFLTENITFVASTAFKDSIPRLHIKNNQYLKTYADQTLVIDHGRIVQQGTHSEMMEQDGIYRDFIGERREAASWKVKE